MGTLHSMCQEIHVALISINVFSQNQSHQINTKELSFFFRYDAFFLNGYHGNNKISQSYFRCVKLFIHKFHVRISSADVENIQDWLLLNSAFTISDVT